MTQDKEPRLNRILMMEMARVTERASVAAARFRGRGDEQAADLAAAKAMNKELANLHFRGKVVIGEPEDAPDLAVGSSVGSGKGPEADIALDPLECATQCVKDLPNAISAMAVAEKGMLLHAPGLYMDKIAIGVGYKPGIVDLEASPKDNIEALAKAKGVSAGGITACILDRSRHSSLIETVRETGASIRLISDGDIAGVIATAHPDDSGIDIYLGSGGAPEGVFAAAALRCIGGQMQGRMVINNNSDRILAQSAGIEDVKKVFSLTDLAGGDVMFAATGITDGTMLDGIRFNPSGIITDTVVMRSATGTVRHIITEHVNPGKFE